MAPSTTKRVVFLDPSLGAASGHHAIVAANYRKLISKRVIFAGNRLLDSGFPAFDYRLEDAFRVSRYATSWIASPAFAKLAAAALSGLRRNRRALPGGELAARGQATLSTEAYANLFRPLRAEASVRRLLDQLQLTADDDLVSLGADPALLCALWRLGDAAAPRLHLLFMYPEADYVGPNVESAYWTIARETASRAAGLYAELDLHADFLSEALARPVAAQITPVRFAPLEAFRPGPEFIVAVLGTGRWDKAFDGLPAIAAATRALDATVRFHIQRPDAGAGLDHVVRALDTMDNVVLLPARLDDDAYEQALRYCGVALLAYDPKRYERRNSGFLVDAQAGGRPIVCARGAALERGARYGNGLMADTPDAFAQAIVEVKTHHGAYLAAAGRHARQFCADIAEGPLVRALRA